MEISTDTIKYAQLGGQSYEKADQGHQINRADWVSDQKFELQKF